MGDMLDAMHRWCDAADAIARRHFGIHVAFETKADGTPVTVADRAIEDLIRTSIARERPSDAIVGEEQGGVLPTAGAAWILDPIDGTKNYARGVPVFATLLARWEDGAVTHAIVSAPGLGSRWWSDGAKAFRDGVPITVSTVATLEEADVCTGGLQAQWLVPEARASLGAALDRVRRHRGFGDFWGYMLVAQGSMEAMIEYAPLKLWDIAAPRCILEAAGGRVTDHVGDPALKEGPVIATNGAVHDDLVRALSAV